MVVYEKEKYVKMIYMEESLLGVKMYFHLVINTSKEF